MNVADQLEDPDSLLHFFRDLISRYRISPELGWGRFDLIEQDTPAVMVHSLTADVGRMIALHNFADEPAVVRFRLEDEPDGVSLVDLLGAERIEVGDDREVTFELPAYGYRWLRVSRPGDGRLT